MTLNKNNVEVIKLQKIKFNKTMEKEATNKISETVKKTLDERLDIYKKNPSDLLDWEEVKDNY